MRRVPSFFKDGADGERVAQVVIEESAPALDQALRLLGKLLLMAMLAFVLTSSCCFSGWLVPVGVVLLAVSSGWLDVIRGECGPGPLLPWEDSERVRQCSLPLALDLSNHWRGACGLQLGPLYEPASRRERADLEHNQDGFHTPRVDVARPVCGALHLQARSHRCAEGRNAREAASCRQEQSSFRRERCASASRRRCCSLLQAFTVAVFIGHVSVFLRLVMRSQFFFSAFCYCGSFCLVLFVVFSIDNFLSVTFFVQLCSIKMGLSCFGEVWCDLRATLEERE